MSTATVRGTVSGMADSANPAFAAGAVALPLAALGYAVTVASVGHHTYVHVMAGVLWTGVDIFMGAVVGPAVGGMDDEAAADFFRRFTPKSAFLMPVLALVTIATGLTLAIRVGYFGNPAPWLALFTLVNLPGALALFAWQFDAWTDPRWALPFAASLAGSLAWVALTVGGLQLPSAVVLAALAIVTVLNLEGFGLILPGELRVYLEMRSPGPPDSAVLAAVGQRNAKLAGVQGVFQLVLIAVMVSMRYGGF